MGSGCFEVEGRVAVDVVEEEGGRRDEVAKLGDSPPEGEAFGRERAEGEGDLEAEGGTGNWGCALAGFVDV